MDNVVCKLQGGEIVGLPKVETISINDSLHNFMTRIETIEIGNINDIFKSCPWCRGKGGIVDLYNNCKTIKCKHCNGIGVIL